MLGEERGRPRTKCWEISRQKTPSGRRLSIRRASDCSVRRKPEMAESQKPRNERVENWEVVVSLDCGLGFVDVEGMMNFFVRVILLIRIARVKRQW